jgi:demethylmenaquinone methyltransferase/2-methoxy-6-polyprenyl-1,4-benzoquinol methylase
MTLPHQPIVARYGQDGDKQAYLRSLFDKCAPHYDRIGGFGFLWTGGLHRRRCLRQAGLRPGMRVLDVACGTGAVTRAIVSVLKGEGSVVGVDPSPGMLDVARRRVRGVEFRAGHAEALPAGTASVDFLSMGHALRHVAQLEAAFCEYRRVLAPGGRVLILEISRPRTGLGFVIARTYFRDILPALSRLATWSKDAHELMRYYWETVDACVPPETILAALCEVGFADVQRRVELGIFSAFTATAPTA